MASACRSVRRAPTKRQQFVETKLRGIPGGGRAWARQDRCRRSHRPEAEGDRFRGVSHVPWAELVHGACGQAVGSAFRARGPDLHEDRPSRGDGFLAGPLDRRAEFRRIEDVPARAAVRLHELHVVRTALVVAGEVLVRAVLPAPAVVLVAGVEQDQYEGHLVADRGRQLLGREREAVAVDDHDDLRVPLAPGVQGLADADRGRHLPAGRPAPAVEPVPLPVRGVRKGGVTVAGRAADEIAARPCPTCPARRPARPPDGPAHRRARRPPPGPRRPGSGSRRGPRGRPGPRRRPAAVRARRVRTRPAPSRLRRPGLHRPGLHRPVLRRPAPRRPAPAPGTAPGVMDDLRRGQIGRKIDQDRAGAALPRDPERLAKGPRNARRILDPLGALGDRTGQPDEIRRPAGRVARRAGPLARAGRLPARDAHQRDRILLCRVQPGDQTCRPRTRGDRDDTGPPRRTGPAVSHERGAFLMASRQPLDAGLLHRRVQREKGGTGAAEDDVDALVLHDLNGRQYGGNPLRRHGLSFRWCVRRVVRRRGGGRSGRGRRRLVRAGRRRGRRRGCRRGGRRRRCGRRR